jgi:K+-sensing histidine kinase KdpD
MTVTQAGSAINAYVRVSAAWERVCRAVSRGEYVALVGPKYCGKTLLVRDVLANLSGEERLCVYVDLAGWQVYQVSGLFRKLVSDILHAIPRGEQLVLPLSPKSVRDSQDFRYLLAFVLSEMPHTIVIALDHIESLPRYLAKALLRCVRVMYTERDVHPDYQRLTVIAVGALNLFELTTSLTSPFNVATLVSIPDADRSQGRFLIEKVAGQLGVQYSTEAVERILTATEGDYYLIQHLCRLAAAQPTWASPKVARPAVERALVEIEAQDPMNDPALGERIRLVEAHPGVLKTVLDVLAGHEVKRRELLTDIDSLELTGVIKIVGHRYMIRNEVFERVLRQYFIPRRVARLFSAFGRWDEAIRYFEQTEPAASPGDRAEYLAAVVSHIYSNGGQQEAFEAIAEALVKGFRAHHVVVRGYVEWEQALVPVAQRGVTGRQQDPIVHLNERSEQPEARAYYHNDYLLERDNEGNSLLVYPLPSGGRLATVGVVTLYNYFPAERHAEWRETVLEIWSFLTQVGRAIAAQKEKQELLRREQQRVQTLSALGNVTRAIMSVRELRSLLKLVVASAKEVLVADVVTLYLYGTETKTFDMPIGVGLRDEQGFHEAPLPVAAGQIAGRIVRERQALVVEDVAGHPAAQRVRFVHREGIHSIAGFPLLRANEPVGVLFVGYRAHHSLSPDEDQIITAFTGQAAIAIENARLYERLAVDHATLSSLYHISTRLRTSLDPEQVLDTITASLQEMFDLATCTVGLLNEAEQRLDFVAHRGLMTPTLRLIEEIPTALWSQLRSGHPVFIPDLTEHPEISELLERKDLASFAVLPLQGREKFLGVLTMSSTSWLQLSESDWELTTALADQAAVAIENAQLHQEIRQAHKALGDSLKILTHELRAEPAFVTNTLSTMLAGKLGELNEAQRDRLAKAQQRLDQHHNLIDNLNFFGRVKGGRIVLRRKNVQLVRTIRAVAVDYQRRAERQDLTFEIKMGKLPLIEVDESMIQVVIGNLLDNAIKFTRPGGSIRLEAWADEQGIHIAVDDTGVGIPVEEWQNVFEEYYQVESVHALKGAGLGLYISRRLVEMHEGSIAVVSKEGPGTRVEMMLLV